MIESIAFLYWLGDKSKRSCRYRLVTRIVSRNDADRNMARGNIVLESLHHPPALDIRQMDVEQDGIRVIIVRHSQRRGTQRCHQSLEAFFMHGIQHEASEAEII